KHQDCPTAANNSRSQLEKIDNFARQSDNHSNGNGKLFYIPTGEEEAQLDDGEEKLANWLVRGWQCVAKLWRGCLGKVSRCIGRKRKVEGCEEIAYEIDRI